MEHLLVVIRFMSPLFNGKLVVWGLVVWDSNRDPFHKGIPLKFKPPGPKTSLDQLVDNNQFEMDVLVK